MIHKHSYATPTNWKNQQIHPHTTTIWFTSKYIIIGKAEAWPDPTEISSREELVLVYLQT